MRELGHRLQLSGIVQIISRRDGLLNLLDGSQLLIPFARVALFQVHAAVCPSPDKGLADPALLTAHAALVRRLARVVKDMLQAGRENFGLELRVAHEVGVQDVIRHGRAIDRGAMRLGSTKRIKARREGADRAAGLRDEGRGPRLACGTVTR